ncbi:MAG: glycosyltransferase [Bacteroidales bacterium]|jgi:undecaprenyl-phosphate 4-deoxy-4-formamido-L-arabinose transferase
MIRSDVKVSIVIPVYNAQFTISELVKQLISEISKLYILEIVLINDCSSDNSHYECLKLYNDNKGIVKYLRLAKNFGEHNSVMAGLNKVTGDFTVIIDDDFQNPVDEVLNLISYSVNNNYDVVYTYYGEKKHKMWRNLGSKLNNYMATLLIKKPKNLYLSSFKCFNKFLVKEIIKYNLPYPYIDGLILRSTSNIGTIQVTHQIRQTGKSGYTLIKLIKLWSNMFTSFSVLPLRVSIFLGLFFAVIGFFLGIYSVIEHFIDPTLPAGFASIATAIFVFAGIQLISLGMLGEYIGRIFISLNKQPQFTIREEYL